MPNFGWFLADNWFKILPNFLPFFTLECSSTPAASTSIPGGLSGIPGFAALAESFPGGPAELQRVLNQPAVLEFISKNPDVIKVWILCLKSPLNPHRFSPTRETDTKITRAES